MIMSIDAVIIGASELNSGEIVLNLDARRNDAPGQSRMTVVDSPPLADLAVIFGCEMWGNSSLLLIGDTVIADRIGYTSLKLRDNWQILAMRTRSMGVMGGKS